MFDKDRTGHINVEEFEKLYTYINQWLAVFKTYDTDQSGNIEEKELTNGKLSLSSRIIGVEFCIALYKERRWLILEVAI